MAPNSASSGTLCVSVNDDFVLDAGRWVQVVNEDQQWVTRVTPPGVHLFQQVADYLESKPSSDERFVRIIDEARAATAACIRWGSYFAVLADASRPFSTEVEDENTSHIADSEMARLNVEISAALQWWLTLKGSDEQRYNSLVRRALAYLPTGRKTTTHVLESRILAECVHPTTVATLQRVWPKEWLERDMQLARKHGIRIIANTLTLLSWRNAPVENVHAGRRPGYQFNKRRILPRHEKAIIRHAQDVVRPAVNAMEHIMYEHAWPPPPECVLPFMRPLLHPRNWSYTQQSLEFDLPLSDC